MLLENGGIAPSTGSVKFGNHCTAIFQSNLVDPILITVHHQ